MSKKNGKETASAAPTFMTMNDLMGDIEREIAAIKSGDLSEPKARIVAKNRDLQLKGMQLVLQAARLEAKFRPELGRRIGLMAPMTIEEVVTGKPQ